MSIRFPITYCIHIPYKPSSEQQLQQQQTTEKVVRGRHDGGYSTQNSNQIFELYTDKHKRNTHNLQQTHMSSTKHACGGTCWLDSPFLLYPHSVPNVHWATVAAVARSSRVQSSCSTHQHRIRWHILWNSLSRPSTKTDCRKSGGGHDGG